MSKQKLIIIGGGAAGLMAAMELAGQYDITILEARSRLGGRIHSFPANKAPFVIEAGPEFIHGHLPITLQLLQQAGIRYVPMKGEMNRKEKGKWKEQTDIIEGWDEVLGKMKSIEKDMTLYDFLQQYYSDDKYAILRKQISSFSEGFDTADVKKVSVKALYEEWSQDEHESSRIPEGYGAMIRFLQEEVEKKGCRILLDHPVKQIEWGNNRVSIYTTDNKKFDGEKAIITVPLTSLNSTNAKGSINFKPAVDEYIKAIHEIGMGTVIKIILLFKQSFWDKEAGFILSDEVISTWWTQLPDTTPLLTGWVGGPRAERLSDHSDNEILDMALLSLASIFEKTLNELKENLVEWYVFNWLKDDYSSGAYSYPMPGTNDARKLLNTPVDNTLFFAGEGLYDGPAPGTVEAALASGKEVAIKCLNHDLGDFRD